MKTIILLTGVVLGTAAIVASPSQARAQWTVGPHLGYHLDASEVNLGATAQIPIPGAKIGTVQLVANPGFEFYPFIGSGASMLAINFDVAYPIPAKADVAPYVGAGLMFFRSSFSVALPGGGTISGSGTDVGLNLKGGAIFMKGKTIQPFGEATLVISDASTLVLRGGVLFTVGKKKR